MNNRKSNNSVLFLTTLGVYLGLVLVGATPVLGHAALTRNFELQDEIEVTDDLDKKPERVGDLDEDADAIENLKIAESITAFLLDLKKLESIGKFDPKEDGVFSHKIWLEDFGGTTTTSKNSDISNPWLETAIGRLIANTEFEGTSSVPDWRITCEGRNCREPRVEVLSTADDLTLKFAFTKSSPESAKAAAMRFSEIFQNKKASLRNSVQLPVYESTTSIHETNQVFIVTRLPRAGLDSLLATNAK